MFRHQGSLLHLIALISLGFVTGCMSLSSEALCHKPVLTGREISTPHRLASTIHETERRLFLFGVFPLGGREVHEILKPYTRSHDGIARLVLDQVMSPLDCLITGATLGIVSAVTIRIDAYHFIYYQPQ